MRSSSKLGLRLLDKARGLFYFGTSSVQLCCTGYTTPLGSNVSLAPIAVLPSEDSHSNRWHRLAIHLAGDYLALDMDLSLV
jgi:hypothetical protein